MTRWRRNAGWVWRCGPLLWVASLGACSILVPPPEPPTSSPPSAAASTRPAPATTSRAPSTTSAGPTSTGVCSGALPGSVPRQPGTPVALPRAAAARALLAGLVTAPRLDGRDFCRSAFGPDQWLDLDRNGCSARQDILVRQAVQLRVGYIRSHGSTCKEALSGTWVDAYTGARITIANLKDGAQAATLQIDHIVSLYEAWVSGAKRWTPAQRLVFAQDVAAPELWAVAGSVNFGKAYRGADSWTPPAPALRCRFATAYVVVKVKYDLTVTAAERASLSTMLATCRA